MTCFSWQYVCSRHFSETDFMLADETHLDRLAVQNLCTVVSHPQSAEHCEEPFLNSSSCEEDLNVLVPTKTYSTKFVTSLTKEPIAIQSETSLHSVVSPDLSLPAETITFSKEDISVSLGYANEISSGGKCGSINFQISSPKHSAWHSLIQLLGLVRAAKLTPQKIKLREFGPMRLWLANLGRSTWQWIWRRFVSWTVIFWCGLFHLLIMYRLQDFWKQLLETVGIRQRVGAGATKERCWLSHSWNVAQGPIPFCNHFLYLPDHSKHCLL